MWEKRDRESNRNDYEDILNEAKRVIFDYKMLLVQIRINHIKQQIDIACKENDSEKADALLKELSEEQKTKTLLSKELGDRVVTP
jgi:adenosyl cobinamide kinase/adenosyl cobinamide phosphate guanylyltransferase